MQYTKVLLFTNILFAAKKYFQHIYNMRNIFTHLIHNGYVSQTEQHISRWPKMA